MRLCPQGECISYIHAVDYIQSGSTLYTNYSFSTYGHHEFYDNVHQLGFQVEGCWVGPDNFSLLSKMWELFRTKMMPS